MRKTLLVDANNLLHIGQPLVSVYDTDAIRKPLLRVDERAGNRLHVLAGRHADQFAAHLLDRGLHPLLVPAVRVDHRPQLLGGEVLHAVDTGRTLQIRRERRDEDMLVQIERTDDGIRTLGAVHRHAGLTMWAGPSKHFKTAFSLLMAKAYQEKYPESVVLFYDSEFGTPQNYFTSFGIDMERVVHTPVTDVEQLKFDVMNQLQNIERGDRVMIVIDSIGNLASKKEVEDALEQKSVGDMTRAKQIKSLFRMVTPHLTLKDIPMV